MVGSCRNKQQISPTSTCSCLSSEITTRLSVSLFPGTDHARCRTVRSVSDLFTMRVWSAHNVTQSYVPSEPRVPVCSARYSELSWDEHWHLKAGGAHSQHGYSTSTWSRLVRVMYLLRLEGTRFVPSFNLSIITLFPYPRYFVFYERW